MRDQPPTTGESHAFDARPDRPGRERRSAPTPNVSASIGFIAYFRVAVLNGLVLLSTIQRRRQEGANAADAALAGSRERLRPVPMTATAASIGFIPVALSHGTGAEVQRPLATVVIGGLVTPTLLTLLVRPTLCAWMEGRRERGSTRRAAAPADAG